MHQMLIMLHFACSGLLNNLLILGVDKYMLLIFYIAKITSETLILLYFCAFYVLHRKICLPCLQINHPQLKILVVPVSLEGTYASEASGPQKTYSGNLGI